jgi:hypothetical protein
MGTQSNSHNLKSLSVRKHELCLEIDVLTKKFEEINQNLQNKKRSLALMGSRQSKDRNIIKTALEKFKV